MSTTVMSLIAGIAKNKQTNSAAAVSLIKEDRDTYTLTEVVKAINAKDILIITVKDPAKEGVVDRNLTKAAELTSELVLLDADLKITLIEGTIEITPFDTADVKLKLDGTGLEKHVVFLSHIAILIKKGEVFVYRCQQLPSGLKIGEVKKEETK